MESDRNKNMKSYFDQISFLERNKIHDIIAVNSTTNAQDSNSDPVPDPTEIRSRCVK